MKISKQIVIRKIVYVLLFSVLISALIGTCFIYSRVFTPNTKIKTGLETYIYIPTGSSFSDVLNVIHLQDILINIESFEWTASRMQYEKNIKAGKYHVVNGMNNRQLISLLRSGRQTPVQVTFNNIRNVKQLAGRISKLLEADSASLVRVFNDADFQLKNGFTVYNGISIIIPNTYEFYWNTSAIKFYDRMLKEYKNFWNGERMRKAATIGLTREQVSTLASIVEQETQQDKEKSMIAGVYLNRVRKKWKLEADPTLVFALGDFSVRRVLNEYKLIDSPYNTYLHEGLPPGPICIPGISSIDAVLNYTEHPYMYFCARDDFSGFHVFAKSYQEHLLNAKKFQRALNKRGILE